MLRLVVGIVLGFAVGYILNRYARRFRAEDMEDDYLYDDDVESGPALIEVGRINSPSGQIVPVASRAVAGHVASAEEEMTEALTAALTESEGTSREEAVDLLSEPGMSIERDEDGSLIITLEANLNPNGMQQDDSGIDYGEIVADSVSLDAGTGIEQLGGIPDGVPAAPDAGIPAAGSDNLQRIRGIGAYFEQKLLQAGITSFAQLAALSPEEVSERTGIPAERIVRNGFIEQADYLARGEEPPSA